MGGIGSFIGKKVAKKVTKKVAKKVTTKKVAKKATKKVAKVEVKSKGTEADTKKSAVNYQPEFDGIAATEEAEVKDTKFVLAPKNIIQEFNNITKSIIEKQLENGKQIQTLQKTRDTLLPKLLSGEIEV